VGESVIRKICSLSISIVFITSLFICQLALADVLETNTTGSTPAGSTSIYGQTQGQEQGQTQGNSNLVNSGQVTINSSAPKYFTAPYQLFPPSLPSEFGNGNAYGNFVKVPAAFMVKKRFSRNELEIMRNAHGTSVKFRSWTKPRQENEKKLTDYVNFVWELPQKQAVDKDEKPIIDEKGHPVMTAYPPATWVALGTGTATVTNGDQDTYSLIAEFGLQCLNTDKCNTVFLVAEGEKSFVRAWGWNLSAGYTQASVSSSGETANVGGVGAGFAYAKTGRLADPWLQGHFIYDSADQPKH